MKKLLAAIMVLLLTSVFLTGCGGTKAKELKTGLAVVTELHKSFAADAEPGLAQIDSLAVAVMVDSDNKIAGCIIDSVQSKINFDSSGRLITPTDTVFPSKLELAGGYGMGEASAIGKEWNEQAMAFAAYAVGKTVEQIKGISVDESGKALDSDLKTSVTISIGGFVEGIEKAVAQAQKLGASSADELALGIVTTMSKSASATDEEPGLAEVYSIYAAASKDSKGKITSCIIDATQGDINFDTSGQILSDLTAKVRSKNELGKNYGMKDASTIGKEWNEQAAAFAQYVTGKTFSEVDNVAVSAEGNATGSDLQSSVTISIKDFKTALAKAAAR
ncbi:MAG: hypothetical protein GX996_07425 [Firmicutes bacterium]|nr:hypothetical protein [Bacillota bacterium]